MIILEFLLYGDRGLLASYTSTYGGDSETIDVRWTSANFSKPSHQVGMDSDLMSWSLVVKHRGAFGG